MNIKGKIWYDKVEYYSFDIDPNDLLDLEDEDDVYDYLIEKMYDTESYDDNTYDSDHEISDKTWENFIKEWRKLKYDN